MDAILPLTIRDLSRSQILRTSLGRFFPELGMVWVVVPDRQLREISRAIKEPRYKVVPETRLIPELRFLKPLRVFSRRYAHGWIIQQVIKLAIAQYIDSDYYLTLDADVICVKPVKIADVIKDGRAKTARSRDGNYHPGWYTRASQLLNLPQSGFTWHSITPCLLSREAVIGLQGHLHNHLGGWRNFLLRHTGWTEYTLYHTFLEGMGLWDKYHFTEEADISSNSVWSADEYKNWNPEKSFLGNQDFFFSVIQSNTGIEAHTVWERVRPWLDTQTSV